jgi:simple sugar transport system substrate-binding protein
MTKSRLGFMLLAIILIIGTLVGCGGAKEDTSTSAKDNGSTSATDEAKAHPLANKRVALIMQMNLGTFSQQYIEGVKGQVEKFGGEVTVFSSDGDLAKMASNLDAAVNQRFDGILIDHGTAEALTAGVNKALEKDIPVVAFDAGLEIPGVTVMEQGDKQMAEMSLEKLASDIGGKGNIVKIWVAGFAPMERRQVAYEAFLQKYPDIKEVAAFGVANANTALDTQSQMEALLKQYPNKGDIAAVWASWDEFAKGATRAIEQAGRTEIKVYGIDMSDEDLQMIQKPNGPWVASAAVDPKDIGRAQVRYLYQKINKDTVEDKIVLNPALVTREALPQEAITTEQLGKHVEGWGDNEQGYTDYLKELEAQQENK